jgi:uncharacterized RDD family membrane protein YckC
MMSGGERQTPGLAATLLHAPSLPTAAASNPDALVGTSLRHFDLLRFLGSGGMGAVYMARDTALDRLVALKVLAPEHAGDPEIVARFVQEARAQARVRHPNVAQIHFIGQDRGLYFSVMEHLEGPTLEQRVADRGRVPWAEAIELAIAAARGLRAAYAQGFIHRDVKPSNLMMDAESGLKLLDFGLVKSLHGDTQLTRDGAIIGSPLYMSPEQGRGDAVDHRSDIYSLGCALYHMLTGQPPFTASSPMGVIALHMTEPAPSPRARVPEVPAPVARIVARMMAKDPSARFPDYDVLIAALERARPGERELSGFSARAAALAIDLAPLLLLFWLLGSWSFALVPIYFVLCWRLRGQTLGKWLLRLEVTDAQGQRVSWRRAALRFAAFAWAPLLWALLGLGVYFVHRDERVTFEIDQLTTSQLTLPLLYIGAVAVMFVAYMAGFLVAAFHPKRLALHDLLSRTEVRYKGGEHGGPVGRVLRATTRLRIALR